MINRPDFKPGDKVVILKWSNNTEFPGCEKYINTVATIVESLSKCAYAGDIITFDNYIWNTLLEDIRLATPVEVLLYGK